MNLICYMAQHDLYCVHEPIYVHYTHRILSSVAMFTTVPYRAVGLKRGCLTPATLLVHDWLRKSENSPIIRPVSLDWTLCAHICLCFKVGWGGVFVPVQQRTEILERGWDYIK